jgi:type IX secretion system PorP/SprF family membrane protein
MKIFSLFLLILLHIGFLNAQQETQLTQIYMNPFLYNPAAGGINSMIDINLGFRQQWTGIQGAPMTIYGSASSPIRFSKKSNNVVPTHKPEKTFFAQPEVTTGMIKNVLGGKFMTTSVGPFNKTSVSASYSFHFPLAKNTNMSFGVSAGYNNFGLNVSRISLYQNEDLAYNTMLGNGGNQNMFDMQAGMFIYSKYFQFGYSATQLIQNKITLSKIMTASNLNIHHFIYAAGMFDLGHKVQISPGIFIGLVKNIPFNIEGNIRVLYKRMAWIMVGYKNSNALTLGIGANLFKYMRLGYSFDLGVGKNSVRNTSHEITLGFIVGKNKVNSQPSISSENIKKSSDTTE